MSKRKGLSLRTKGIIEHMWSRGISAVSIAGSTQARLDRVEAYILELRNERGDMTPSDLPDDHEPPML